MSGNTEEGERGETRVRYKFNATAEQAPERDNTSSERRHVPNKHSTWEWVWECADEARRWQSWQRQRRVGERSTNRPPKLCRKRPHVRRRAEHVWSGLYRGHGKAGRIWSGYIHLAGDSSFITRSSRRLRELVSEVLIGVSPYLRLYYFSRLRQAHCC